MSDAIGRADYELGATLDKLRAAVADAEKVIADSGKKAEAEYQQAGQAAGEKFGKAWAVGARVLAGAAAGVLAMVTKGQVELQNAAADFRAETGATAEEAKRAGKAINEMSGRNVQGIAEIGGALTKVHTDLGLTGEAAEKTTERFLKYARVTKQDASAAVLAFDDVLDAWGLTAEDAQGIMDKLVASHQKYGGSIAANQDALAKMAPALKALNATTDDGIALLNLFAASGLDASQAQRGLNTAVAQMPAGTTLADFVAQLAAIKDPADRAAKASEVFGTMAGPKLANALGNATDGLDAYTISATDAAGATDKANEALDGTFTAQVQARFRALSAAIRGIASDWSPALTGAAAFASGLTAIVGPQNMGKLREAATGGLKAVWEKVGGSTIVKAAVTAAGAVAGAVYSAAAAAAEQLMGSLAGAWARMASSAPVLGAISAAGGAAGTAFSLAASAAIVALPVVIVTAWKTDTGSKELADMREKVAAAVADGSTEGLVQARGQLLKDFQQFTFDGSIFNFDEAKATLETSLATIQAAIRQKTKDSLDEMYGPGMAAAAKEGGTAAGAAAADGMEAAYARSKAAIVATTRATMQAVHNAIIAGKSLIVSAWNEALTERNRAADIKDQLLINRSEQRAQKKIIADQKATAAERAQARIALRQLQADHDALIAEQAGYGTRSQQIAKTKALLTSKELLKGLKDKDPDVREHWKNVKEQAEHQLELLVKDGKGYGTNFTDNFADGLVKDIDRVKSNAALLSQTVKKYLQVHSPSELGAFSEMGGPEGWGRRWIELYTAGLGSGIDKVNSLLGGVVGMPGVAASAAGALMSPAAGFTASGTATVRVEHRLTPDAATALKSAGYDEAGVARALADASGLYSGLRQLAAMTSG